MVGVHCWPSTTHSRCFWQGPGSWNIHYPFSSDFIHIKRIMFFISDIHSKADQLLLHTVQEEDYYVCTSHMRSTRDATKMKLSYWLIDKAEVKPIVWIILCHREISLLTLCWETSCVLHPYQMTLNSHFAEPRKSHPKSNFESSIKLFFFLKFEHITISAQYELIVMAKCTGFWCKNVVYNGPPHIFFLSISHL